MQLSVPQRGLADRDSFPIEPEDVGRWLERLSLASENAAREVLRGLKHSNRLHNDPARRRAVLGRFLPVLRELHEQLIELTRAQPLPLVREFARGTTLIEALLREEAFAYKILLSDSAQPDLEDARRAMRALARQADVVVHGYRRLPDALLEDAHALYALVESFGLLESRPAPRESDPEEPAFIDHYRYVLLLAIADTHQLKARQLPFALDFLREAATEIKLSAYEEPGRRIGQLTFAVDLAKSARPERAPSLLIADPRTVRLFEIATVLQRIDRSIGRIRTAHNLAFGVDILERQTLAHVRAALAGERVRRAARPVSNDAQPALFGHKEIATRLLFDMTRAEDDTAPVGDDAGWTLVNRSTQGAGLICLNCLPGTVQVGELVALTGTDPRKRPASGRAAALLGSVRWIRSDGSAGITLGLEYLARGVMPVSVVPSDARTTAAENALIIACKIQQSLVQTILLPPYLHETGDRLKATQGRRSREIRLKACLQNNGLFGHFLLE